MAVNISKSAKKVKAKGKAQTEITHPDKTVEGFEDELDFCAEVAPHHLASVGYLANYTKNLGNYEFLKVHVVATVPCHVGRMDTAFEYASEWVDTKMEQVLAEFNGEESPAPKSEPKKSKLKSKAEVKPEPDSDSEEDIGDLFDDVPYQVTLGDPEQPFTGGKAGESQVESDDDLFGDDDDGDYDSSGLDEMFG